MKPRIRYLMLAGLIAPLIFFSCKTTDTGAGASLVDGHGLVEEDLSGPADEVSLAALAEAEAKAKEARAMAEYVNGPVHRPDEWKAAETRFKEADSRGAPETKGDVYERVAEWDAIKLAYDDIYKGSLDKFAQEQQEILAKAREKAVEAGAGDLVPDRLAMADALADKSKQLSAAGDINGSVLAGKEARDRYQILETLALAHKKQMEADEYDFFLRDPDNYLLAANAGNNAVDLYDEGDLAKSQAEADVALEKFRQVVRNGWNETVEETASVTKEWRDAALEIKANVAVRSDYSAAETVYNQAYVALRAEKYTEAIDLFAEAGGLFETAYENAMEKRIAAEEALQRTEQKLVESEELGQYADDIIGGDE